MPKKIDFLIAKIEAYEKPLERLDNKTKAQQVPIPLAQNFNKLLEEIASEFPKAAAELPQAISLSGNFHDLGVTDVSHVSLEIMVRQVLSVLEVLKNDK